MCPFLASSELAVIGAAAVVAVMDVQARGTPNLAFDAVRKVYPPEGALASPPAALGSVPGSAIEQACAGVVTGVSRGVQKSPFAMMLRWAEALVSEHFERLTEPVMLHAEKRSLYSLALEALVRPRQR